MRRWKVTAVVDHAHLSTLTALRASTSWVGFVDAETRDEAQHIGRERCLATATVDTREAFKGATITVEPVTGRGWT